ncbi:MAG TPA: cytochrome c oxidase assembly protein [Woeseiaceae bacterium]|nr:cytochrome c oxidase assembly protein [Woeseiaceae bacterium]
MKKREATPVTEDRIEAQPSIGAAGKRWSGHRLCLLAGLAVLLAVWLTPLPRLAGSGFAADVLVNVAVLGLAAPLIAAALAASPGLMARLPDSLVSPMPVALAGFGVVWLWHIPVLHGLAGLSRGVWIAEQASFAVAGLLLWTTALRPASASGREAGAGILALLLTATHLVLLGTLLALAPRPLYTYAIDTLGDAYAELAAQRVGGMLMLLAGFSHLAGALYLVNRLLRQPPDAVAPRLRATSDGR